MGVMEVAGVQRLDFASSKTLMRDLGEQKIEDMIQEQV